MTRATRCRSGKTARTPRAATFAPRKAAPRSSNSSRPIARMSCAGRRKYCTPTATAFRMWPPRWCRSSISRRWRRLENAVGVPVDPLRFRGNVYVSGWPAWHEFDLLGKTIAVGPARLKVTKRIVRCAATNVEPRTGIRDLQIPKTLMQTFGHMDCGIYAQVSPAARSLPAIRSPNPHSLRFFKPPSSCGRGVCAEARQAGRTEAAG